MVKIFFHKHHVKIYACSLLVLFFQARVLVSQIDAETQASQHFSNLDENNSKLVEQFANDTFIEKIYQETEQNISDEFIDSIVNAEQIKIDQQRTHNNTIFYQPQKSPIALYNKDIYKAGLVGIDILTEWFLYKKLSDFFIHDMIARITQNSGQAINQELAESDILKISFTELFKSSFLKYLLAYAVSMHITKHTRKSFLLNNQADNLLELLLGKDVTKENPISVFSLLEATPLISIPVAVAQGDLSDLINDEFRKHNMLEPILDNRFIEYAKEIFVAGLSAQWMFNEVLMKSWQDHSKNNAPQLQAIKEMLANQQTKKAGQEFLEAYLKKGTKVSFLTWLGLKSMQQTKYHTITNVIVSLPSWYRICRWIYQITKPLFEEDETIGKNHE